MFFHTKLIDFNGVIRKKLKNVSKEVNQSILKLDRQFLHAKVLGFIHPRSGKKLFFVSNLPEELKKIINLLEKSD